MLSVRNALVCLVVCIPPKVAISYSMGVVKGISERTSFYFTIVLWMNHVGRIISGGAILVKRRLD